MARDRRSLVLTERYRDRLQATKLRVERLARQRWPARIEDFDAASDPWRTATAQALTLGQRELVRVTAAYLGAFATLELGRTQRPPEIDATRYVGLSRDGRTVTEALESPLIGVRAALADGLAPNEALRRGLQRAVRMVDLDTLNAPRVAMMDAIAADERFAGWQRAVSGTCGACAAVASGPTDSTLFEVHPNCECVAEPQVRGVRDLVPRLTGAEIMAEKTPAEQNAALGEAAADAFRDGLPLHRLVKRDHLDSDAQNFITQRPLDEAAQSH